MLHVLDLEKHAHSWRERNSLIAYKRQNFIVIHHSIHGLNPSGINVTIKNYPLVKVSTLVAALILAHVSHDDCNCSVSPFLALGHCPVQLISSDGLGVHLLPHTILAIGTHSLHERLPGLGLATSSRTNYEAAVAHKENVKQTHNLQNHARISLQAAAFDNIRTNLLKAWVLKRFRFDSREEVLNQSEEDWQICGCDLRDVEIPQSAAKNGILIGLRLLALERAGLPQKGLHRAQSPIVMRLLGEQLAAERVESDKFAS
mmetsp:Transcript_78140/g.142103  ORF Transcript_78140/g.142103 Transcript_78140/m.142103 type:complete len:259 (+) Transcript_78140:796-1572(+)